LSKNNHQNLTIIKRNQETV
jgi:hypothetical protein